MRYQVALLSTLAVLAAGCKDEPMTADEIRHYKELYDRPTEIDTTPVESFEIEINGEDGFSGHPQAVVGEPIEFKGRLILKEGVLTSLITGSLRAGYRKVEDGTANWSIDESIYKEFHFGAMHINEADPEKIDSKKSTARLKPGLYELRYYLLLKKFDPSTGSDTFTGIYYLADGQLEILPADGEE